jgi:hypothetical protein
MNEEELQRWRINCKKEVISQIILNKIKKRKLIKRKKEKEIQRKINLLGYKNLLSSPHLEGKEELKKKAITLCINNYLSSVDFTK